MGQACGPLCRTLISPGEPRPTIATRRIADLPSGLHSVAKPALSWDRFCTKNRSANHTRGPIRQASGKAAAVSGATAQMRRMWRGVPTHSGRAAPGVEASLPKCGCTRLLPLPVALQAEVRAETNRTGLRAARAWPPSRGDDSAGRTRTDAGRSVRNICAIRPSHYRKSRCGRARRTGELFADAETEWGSR